MERALTATDLGKTYGDGVWALDGATFEVGYGEIFAFLGRNGTGKTTAVRILTDNPVEPYRRDMARVAGHDVLVEPELALVLLGLGFGLAVPGYTTAPTLLVGDEAQGGVAGLISATNGLAFVLGPLLGTTLYGLRPEYPYVFGAAVLALVAAFAYAHPRVRQVKKS